MSNEDGDGRIPFRSHTIKGMYVRASAISGETVQVGITADSPGGGCWYNYMSADQARELAQALNAAADHYDAETARIGQQAQQAAADLADAS